MFICLHLAATTETSTKRQCSSFTNRWLNRFWMKIDSMVISLNSLAKYFKFAQVNWNRVIQLTLLLWNCAKYKVNNWTISKVIITKILENPRNLEQLLIELNEICRNICQMLIYFPFIDSFMLWIQYYTVEIKWNLTLLCTVNRYQRGNRHTEIF